MDFELRGCPINKQQLVEVISAFLHGRKPVVSAQSVCVECKLRGTPCIMVAQGIPCLGPITHAGCSAICPAHARGCYGCYGPQETPNMASFTARWQELGAGNHQIVRVLRTFNAHAPAFRQESIAHADQKD